MRPIVMWSKFMTNIVRIAPRTGQDAYGKPTYGAAVTYKAHIANKRNFVRSSTGENVESNQSVHLMSADVIQPTAQITLSTADVGSTEPHAINPTIVNVTRRFDQGGAHHTVLYL